MLNSRSTCAVGLLSLTMLSAAPSAAFALSELLSRPEVAISLKSKLSAKEVMKVLTNSKYKFVSGWTAGFGGTTLVYSGTTDNLTDFLNGLAGVKGAKVSLEFSKNRGVADTAWHGKKIGKKTSYQWMVSHHRDQFGITVFLGDGKIKKGDLDIPPRVTTQPVKKTKKPAKSGRK